MDSAYDQLLAATVSHLEDLKARGVKYLPVSPDLVMELGHPGETAAPSARPARPFRNAPVTQKPVERESKDPTPSVPTAVPVVPNDLIVDPSVELTPARKEVEMARIHERASHCVKCPHLASSRRNVVFGVGNVNAELMFVGEAPGMDEDAQGEPFVGAAGQLLTRIIRTMGLDRDRVYIANILKCRPDTPGQRTGNRKPTTDEMNTCKPYLQAQISVIRPKVIVALGVTAVEGLLGKSMGIMKLRGNWRELGGVPLMPTYHPAYLLRNQSLAEKRKVWEDMLAVMERLGMPISDKQRGFFLAK